MARETQVHLEHFRNVQIASIVAFKAAFGATVCYDNLGMHEHPQEALHQLQILAEHVGCK